MIIECIRGSIKISHRFCAKTRGDPDGKLGGVTPPPPNPTVASPCQNSTLTKLTQELTTIFCMCVCVCVCVCVCACIKTHCDCTGCLSVILCNANDKKSDLLAETGVKVLTVKALKV